MSGPESPPPEPSPTPGAATRILRRLRTSDARAADDLQQILASELRNLASRAMATERPDHTLEPTALVHEAWIKLFERDANQLDLTDRHHFLAVSARAMRQVLVDHARGRNRLKRAGATRRADLEPEALPARVPDTFDFPAVDAALTDLQTHSERQAQVVELRFFGGLSTPEIAAILDVSERTVEREWRFAKAWLTARLGR